MPGVATGGATIVFRLETVQSQLRPEAEYPTKAQWTAIMERVPEGGYWAICLEVPGAHGQAETREETRESLREAIKLIRTDR